MSSITPIEIPDKAGPREKPGMVKAQNDGLLPSTARYLLRTEVHTFAFSVAANAILSFFPFMLLLMTLIRRVFHSQTMYDVVVSLLRDYLPAGQEFVIRNLNALVEARQRAQVLSLAILLVTSTGVFLPLEVALNRVWGFRNNRSYLGNQLIALGLAFACGSLALLSIGLTAGNVAFLKTVLRGHGALVYPARGIHHHEGFRDRRQHRHLLLDLLAAAQRKSARARCTADRDPDGIAVGGAEVCLHPCPAPAEFRGSVRTVRDLGQPDVLGVLVGDAAADGGASVGAQAAEFVSSRQIHSRHRVADFGKVFSINPNTVRGRTTKIGSPMLRGSILYFFV